MRKVLVILIFLLSGVGLLHAQSTYSAARTDTNNQPYPSPFPAVPAINNCFSDTEYFSTAHICRVTDGGGTVGGTMNGASVSGSAEVNLFSSDDTRFVWANEASGVWEADSLVPNSDPASFSHLYMLGGCDSGYAYAQALQFSYIQPKIVYGLCWSSSGDIEIGQYDLTSATAAPTPANGKATVLKDLASCDSSLAGLGQMGVAYEELGVSTDDQTFAIMTSTSGGQDTAGYTHVVLWNRNNGCRTLNTSTGAVGGSWGTTGTMAGWTPFFGHNGRLNQDGTYFKITPSSASALSNVTALIWNISSLNYFESCNSCGHDVIGVSNWMRAIWQAPTQVAYAAFSWVEQGVLGGNNITPASAYQPGGDPSTDGHLSWNNDNANDTNPVFTSTFRGTNPVPSVARENEIVAVSTNGSGLLYRFSHTYSSLTAANGFDAQEAIGAVSASGKYYMWSTDWNNSLGSGRSDLFIMHLPLDGSTSAPTATNPPTNLKILQVN